VHLYRKSGACEGVLDRRLALAEVPPTFVAVAPAGRVKDRVGEQLGLVTESSVPCMISTGRVIRAKPSFTRSSPRSMAAIVSVG
jgi:hypothetical protein